MENKSRHNKTSAHAKYKKPKEYTKRIFIFLRNPNELFNVLTGISGLVLFFVSNNIHGITGTILIWVSYLLFGLGVHFEIIKRVSFKYKYLIIPLIVMILFLAYLFQPQESKTPKPIASSADTTRTTPVKRKNILTSNKRDTVYIPIEKKVTVYVPAEKKEDLIDRFHVSPLGIVLPYDTDLANILANRTKNTYPDLSSSALHTWNMPSDTLRKMEELLESEKLHSFLLGDIDANKPNIEIKTNESNIPYKGIFRSVISISITIHDIRDIHVQIIGNSIISVSDIEPIFLTLTFISSIRNLSISNDGAIFDIPSYSLPKEVEILHSKPENFQFKYGLIH